MSSDAGGRKGLDLLVQVLSALSQRRKTSLLLTGKYEWAPLVETLSARGLTVLLSAGFSHR